MTRQGDAAEFMHVPAEPWSLDAISDFCRASTICLDQHIEIRTKADRPTWKAQRLLALNAIRKADGRQIVSIAGESWSQGAHHYRTERVVCFGRPFHMHYMGWEDWALGKWVSIWGLIFGLAPRGVRVVVP